MGDSRYANKSFNASAMVGCVKIMSRKVLAGAPRSIASLTILITSCDSAESSIAPKIRPVPRSTIAFIRPSGWRITCAFGTAATGSFLTT